MKTRFFALATLALALAACNNDNENLNGDPVAAQFTADIAPATRASGTTWDNGIFSINARQNPSDFRKDFCFIRISASVAYHNGIAVCQNLLLTYAENVIDYK